MALGEGVGHQRGDGRHVDLQRVDAQVRLPCEVGQPGGEGFQIEFLARSFLIVHLLCGEKLQRVLAIVQRAATDRQALLSHILIDPALGHQLAQQVAKIQYTVRGGSGEGGHAGSSGSA